jgi:S-layer homology domain
MFEDILPGSTFYDFVWRLASRGYISGYPCGGAGEPCDPTNLPYFRPSTSATRGQISKIVSNSAGFSEPPGAQLFEDVPPGSTFYNYVQRLASRGITSGYPCGGVGEPCDPSNLPYFRPNNNATRGQTSKIDANAFFPDCMVSEK